MIKLYLKGRSENLSILRLIGFLLAVTVSIAGGLPIFGLAVDAMGVPGPWVLLIACPLFAPIAIAVCWTAFRAPGHAQQPVGRWRLFAAPLMVVAITAGGGFLAMLLSLNVLSWLSGLAFIPDAVIAFPFGLAITWAGCIAPWRKTHSMAAQSALTEV